jgi:mono/diheme cytochrome c family protein
MMWCGRWRLLTKGHRASSLVCASLLLLAGCGPRYGPGKSEAQLTPPERAGERVFVQRCAGCHWARSSEPLHGPGLFALYRKPYLPSGAPANDERVSATVLRGRGMMPAFGSQLDEEEMAELLAYLRTL